MKIELFTLCDAATDSGGKLNILGSFDHISAKEIPAIHPFCAIAIKIRFAKIEEGNHKLKITIADADGKLVIPGLDASLAIRFGSEETVAANVVMLIQKIKFEQFGEYTIDLAIDGRQEGSIPLYVLQRKKDARGPIRPEGSGLNGV